MVNTRSAKESKTKVSAEEGRTVPDIEIDLETPDQSVDEVERKTTESTPMPNVDEQEKKTIEERQDIWNGFCNNNRGQSSR